MLNCRNAQLHNWSVITGQHRQPQCTIKWPDTWSIYSTVLMVNLFCSGACLMRRLCHTLLNPLNLSGLSAVFIFWDIQALPTFSVPILEHQNTHHAVHVKHKLLWKNLIPTQPSTWMLQPISMKALDYEDFMKHWDPSSKCVTNSGALRQAKTNFSLCSTQPIRLAAFIVRNYRKEKWWGPVSWVV